MLQGIVNTPPINVKYMLCFPTCPSWVDRWTRRETLNANSFMKMTDALFLTRVKFEKMLRAFL